MIRSRPTIAIHLALLAFLFAPPALAAPTTVPAGILSLLFGQKSSLDKSEEEEEPLPKRGKPSKPASQDAKPSPAAAGEARPPQSPGDPTSGTKKPQADKPSADQKPPPGTGQAPASAQPADKSGTGVPAQKPPEQQAPGTRGGAPGAKKSPLDEEEEPRPAAAQPPAQPPAGPPKPASKRRGSGLPARSTVGEDERPADPVCDEVFYRKPGVKEPASIPVVLFKHYRPNLTGPASANDVCKLQRISSAGKVIVSLQGKDIDRIEYYEERMLRSAAQELGLTSAQLAQPGRLIDLSSPKLLDAAVRAEKRLSIALSEHDSAVQRNLREGLSWENAVREPLMRAWTNLRLGRIDEMIRQGKLDQADLECDRLASQLDRRTDSLTAVRVRAERIFAARSAALIQKNEYAAVHDLLDGLARRFPGEAGDAVHQVEERLVAKAKALVRDAETIKASSPEKALQVFEQAALVWPGLPGLEDKQRTCVSDYPMLHCAYTSLPGTLSPLEARTPVERHAVGLIFESLVRWHEDPQVGSHYCCQLAERLPTPLPRGRCFEIPRVKWSDSTPDAQHVCTVEDVRWTVRLLQNRDLPGYSPAAAALLKSVDNSEDADPFRVLIRLQRDHWHPLSLMDFKILPRHCFAAQQAETLPEQVRRFGERPVGTGPYRPVAENETPDSLRFVVNPNYRKSGLPHIREIVFHRLDPTKAVELFLQGKMDLLYGVLPEHVNQLDQQHKKVASLRTPTVTFLAPNHRRAPFRNRNLRLAIVHAIDREAILKQFFRPGRNADSHLALSGPFPRDSWAANLRDGSGSHSAAQAKTFADLARNELGGAPLELTLTYPAGNTAVENACRQIEIQVESAGIKLELVRAEPEEFRREVLVGHNFDLAYWDHCYKGPTFWLEPLLDADPAAQAENGPNFLGYTPDPTMSILFDELRLHKCFTDISAAMHKIHEHLMREAVLIPLWQLDTFVALGDRIEGARLDPLELFGDIDRWQLAPRRPR